MSIPLSQDVFDSQSFDMGSTQPVPVDSELGGFENLKVSQSKVGKLISFNPKRYEHREMKPEQIIALGESPIWVLGRSPKCQFKIPEKEHTVSSQHFKILFDNDIFMIEDLSSNGTYINKKRIAKGERKILQHMDIISLVFPFGQKEDVISYVFEFQVQQFEDPTDPILKKYQFGTLMGTGNFSQVYHARQNQTGKEFAIKVIDKRKYWNNTKTLKQLETEAKILTSLSHDHIIKLYEVISSDTTLYLVMELAQGGELFDQIRDVGFYSESHAKRIFQQLLEAVKYLHSKNIAHRDLKPENILLNNSHTQNVEIKLTDFGLATLIGPSNMLTTTCGTPQYVAPEVIRRGLNPDKNNGYNLMVDMWSLGAILYILLSGFPPFDDELDMYDQILNAKYDFPPELFQDVSAQAIDLIRKLLNPDPLARLTAAQALQHPWLTNKTNSTSVLNSAQKGFSTLRGSGNARAAGIQLFPSPDDSTDEEDANSSFIFQAPHGTSDREPRVEGFMWSAAQKYSSFSNAQDSENIPNSNQSFPKRRASDYDPGRKTPKTRE